ncbi:MAG: cytochrome bd-I oxidase subunit CydX [Gammaproteobacteria bacterium]|jgi:cyd operon protein YbgT
MWYFTWILGVLFACACGIMNAMWVEMHLAHGTPRDVLADRDD